MTSLEMCSDATILDAVCAIESTYRRIAVVIDTDRRLLGTLTDGDIRRHLLQNKSLQLPVTFAMNEAPVTASQLSSARELAQLMREKNLAAVPLLDNEGRFIEVVHVSEISKRFENYGITPPFEFAVIMAGGEGLRLRPITEKIPKPMINVGGIPLLERQIKLLANSGCPVIYLSLNYLGHLIEDHFQDGRQFDVEIHYLYEKEKLGTAGSLSLLPKTPTGNILVMNGDIVTDCSFRSLAEFHEKNNGIITIAAVDYSFRVPFGVIHFEGSSVQQLEEKPIYNFFCNAGIYALNPKALKLIRSAEKCDMTDLINRCLGKKERVSIFPVHEFWSDIGTPDDLRDVRSKYGSSEDHD